MSALSALTEGIIGGGEGSTVADGDFPRPRSRFSIISRTLLNGLTTTAGLNRLLPEEAEPEDDSEDEDMDAAERESRDSSPAGAAASCRDKEDMYRS